VSLLLENVWTIRSKAPHLYRMEVDGRFHALAILLQGRNSLGQECTIRGHHIVREIKFYTVVHNICASLVSYSLHVTVTAPRIIW
jgi:hypothetical protein